MTKTVRAVAAFMLFTSLAGGQAMGQAPAPIRSLDHHVDVVSTAPASAGRTMRLYLRERVRADAAPDPDRLVLFVHGAGTPAEVGFDVPYADYSWMAYLAASGFDVFSVDMEGYGRSERPAAMNDLCNLSPAQRAQHHAPADCKPSQTGGVTTLASDWNDVDAAVNYVLGLRHARKLSLVAWSQGGPRAGGWAAQHPDKVNRMVLLAPAYNNRTGLPPAPGAPAPAPRGPTAFNTQTEAEFYANWDRQAPCPGQYDKAAAASVWREMLASDPVGAGWSPPGRRAPTTAPGPGWTQAMVKATTIPILMVSGENDGQVKPQNVRNLYADLGGDKVFVDLACSSHNAMWEKNHLLLFAASREWLQYGTVNGQKNVMLRLGY